MATCDSVAQPMLMVLYVTCFVVVLFSLFTSVLLRLQLQLQYTKSEKLLSKMCAGRRRGEGKVTSCI